MINNKIFLGILISIIDFKRDKNKKSEIQIMKTIKIVPNWFQNIIKNKRDVIKIKDKILFLYTELIEEKLLSQKEDEVTEKNIQDFFQKTYVVIEDYHFHINNHFSAFYWYLHLESDNEIKNDIQQILSELENFIIKEFTYNKSIYILLKKVGELYLNYPLAETNEKKLIQDTFYNYKKIGIDLSEEKQKRLKEVSLLLSNISREFELNIQNQDNHIIAKEKDLTGLNKEQIARLKKLDNGDYKIGVDYPTNNLIMSYCDNSRIRKDLYIAFNTRAYPINVSLLEQIRNLTHEQANIIGYSNYAELDIEPQMAKTVENVEKFLDNSAKATASKALKEKELLTDFAKNELFQDESYVIHPWDVPYIFQKYESMQCAIDAEEIAAFFPVIKTIEKIITIYSKFFDLTMEMVSYEDDSWQPSSEIIILRITKNGQEIGDLLFDLYPRQGKYSHACFSGIVSSVYHKNNSNKLKELPLGLIIANFNRPTEEHDGLLKYEEARTLFHEMGHALHHFLGTTEFFSQSGTSTMYDFVEVPSQLFEQWLLEKDILKEVSGHYKTNERMKDEIIEKIIKLEFYNLGLFIQRQINSSRLALHLFTQHDTPVETIREKLAQETISLSYYDNIFNQSVYSFGHISCGVYGPKYYVYLWSLVYAIDFFQKIKTENGLLDKTIGNKLINTVLKKAGFEDPEILSELFLEKKPSLESFFTYLNR